MSLYVFVAARVGQISAHTTSENYLFDLNNVFSSATFPYTKGSSALMSPPGESIFLVMSFSMKMFFSFASLNPNAGSCLRQEILILPQKPSPTTSYIGGMYNHDHMHFVPATNHTQVPANTGADPSTSQ
jgi:hypothetical protein